MTFRFDYQEATQTRKRGKQWTRPVVGTNVDGNLGTVRVKPETCRVSKGR